MSNYFNIKNNVFFKKNAFIVIILKFFSAIRIAYLFIFLLIFANSCKRTSSYETNTVVNTDTLFDAIGIVMNADSIKPPIAIKAKRGKTINLGSPNVKPIESNNVAMAGFSYMQNYTTSNGLALDVITDEEKSALCDKNGNLWFGTGGGGVSRYDGKSFTNFSSANGLIDNVIRSIVEDRHCNIWFGTSNGVSCYNGIRFTNFSKANGLISNVVKSITEDKNGNLWFCTDIGISRYDGNRFTNFTTKQGLPGNIVFSSKEDKEGNLWFGTNAGVCRYNVKQANQVCDKNTCKHNLQSPTDIQEHNQELSKAFTNFSTLNGLSNNIVTCIQEDSYGKLYFGTYGGGINIFNEKKQLCIKETCKHSIKNRKELKDHNHQIDSAFTSFSTKQGLISNFITAITVDKNGHLWLATPEGASCYDGINFTNFTVKQGLSNNIVTSITEDKSGNLWFGTFGGGINSYKGKAFINYSKNQGLNSEVITSIIQDSSGVLWFASYTNGLVRYDGNFFTTFKKTETLEYTYAKSLVLDKNGNLCYGLMGNGICFYDKNKITNYTTLHGLVNNNVLFCTKDKKGKLWFGTEGGVSCYDGENFINFTNKQGLVSNYVYCIYEDNYGNIWFGTQNGLSCYNGNFFINYKKEQGLISNNVFSIAEDKYNNLWLATENGLSRFDGKSFLNYTISEGLPNNVITQIVISKQQHLVLGTNDGLGVFTSFFTKNNQKNTAEKEMQKSPAPIPVINKLSNNQLKKLQPNVEIYNAANGYLVKDVNGGCNSMYKDKKGIIWIGTGSDKSGLVRFDYSALNKQSNPVKVILQNIKINHQRVNWYNLHPSSKSDIVNSQQEMMVFGKTLTAQEKTIEIIKFGNITFDTISKFYPVPQNLTLPFKNNTITFEYAGIEPSSQYLVMYQCMLEGYDDDWQTVANNTEINYGNLYEGCYNFKVKAAINQSDWSEPVSYKFTVLPPYYRAWWAYSVYIVGFIGIVFGYSKWRNKKLKNLTKLIIQKQEEEKQRISRDLHDDLGQELLYLKMKTEIQNKPNVDRVLNKIRTISYNLNHSKLTDSTIKGLIEELLIEAEKSGVFFSYEIDDITIKNYDIRINLYRITQEAINNIIKHSKAQNARITLNKTGGQLVLEIRDDGIGIKEINNTSTVGLGSMKERAFMIGANLIIETSTTGTYIKLKLKLTYE